MADLIDRQAAIDAVCMEWCNVKHQDCKHPFDGEEGDYYWCDGCETVLRTLPDLPSAQPVDKDINVPVNDLISRQAAIDAVNEYLRMSEVSKTVQNMTSIQAILRWLPTAEPKTGEWTSHSVGHEHIPWGFDCSNCGKWFVISKDDVEEYNFCPNCGAKMEGEDNERSN